jgi:transcriptional regulator with XRE-family HTH domain
MIQKNHTLTLKMIIIAANVRDRRLKLNHTQKHVANKLAISQNAYSKIERGGSKMTIERLLQIATIFETDIRQLLHIKDKMPIDCLREMNLRAKVR